MEFKLPETCMSCKKPIEAQGHIECLECGKPCIPEAINHVEIEDAREGEMMGIEVKSTCCNADVRMVNIRSTCSDQCHENIVSKMESEMGVFTIDTDPEGVRRKIPTRDLFEKGGLTREELRSYPKAETNITFLKWKISQK